MVFLPHLTVFWMVFIGVQTAEIESSVKALLKAMGAIAM